MMSYSKVIDKIGHVPHYREFICGECGTKQSAYSLLIQTNCQKCNARVKLRGYGALGSEVEDVIDAVLAWIGKGEKLEQALLRKKEIDADD